VILPHEPARLYEFLIASGLIQSLSGQAQPGQPRTFGECAPIQTFSTHSLNDPDRIIELVSKHKSITPDSEDYLRICINEVIQNVEDHAESPVGAVMCGRFMSQSSEIRVSIVDRGVGIVHTLRRRYGDVTNAATALRRVTQGGYTAKSSDRNQGLGISNLCNIVQHLKGKFFIITGDAMATFNHGPISVESADFFFPGTGLFFTLPVEMD
jgi:anti-sigma regulatory factor (Ser/Thr protein kinase)